MSLVNIISAIGNNSSIYPLLIRDCGIENPVKIGLTYRQNLKDSKQMAKDAFRERVIDEYVCSAIWLGGIPVMDKICDWGIKKLGYDPDVNINLLKETQSQGLEKNIEKFKNLAENEVKSLEKVLKNKKTFEKLQAVKFVLSTAIPVFLMGYCLPKSNFALTNKLRKEKEKLTPVLNTITNQVTKVLGVVSVTNAVAPTSYGQEQETDGQFRVRRNRSTAIRGQNNYDAMNAQLLELNDVTDALVHVNNTGSEDDTETAAYTIWAIVEGGANDDIATVIYQNGCGLNTRGAVPVTTRNVAGQVITVNFDRANPVRLYISCDLKVMQVGANINTTNLAELIANNLSFNLSAPAETSYITEVAANQLLSITTGAYILNVQVSTDNSNWEDFIASASLS